MSLQTANHLKAMMVTAASKGTGQGVFGKRKRGKKLRGLTIGGKTGSINNSTDHDIRYDLFVGFGEDSETGRKLAVSVIVAHQEFIGPRAMDYAKKALEYYFQ